MKRIAIAIAAFAVLPTSAQAAVNVTCVVNRAKLSMEHAKAPIDLEQKTIFGPNSTTNKPLTGSVSDSNQPNATLNKSKPDKGQSPLVQPLPSSRS